MIVRVAASLQRAHMTISRKLLSQSMPLHLCNGRASHCKIRHSSSSTNNDSTSPPESDALADCVQVSIDRQTGIARVRLNRPDKLNSLNLDMFRSIVQAAKSLQPGQSPYTKMTYDIRAIIITGNGRAFSSGLDIQSFMGRKNPVSSLQDMSRTLLDRPEHELANLAQQVAYEWRQVPVPVIACLHGMCFGGGLQIALGADFRFATPDCKISIMEGKWGLIPDMSAAVTLRELISIDVAKELTMTARVITGEQAGKLGLVTRVCEDPEEEAELLAKEIAQRSPDAVAFAKDLYQKTWVADDEYCLTAETELQRKLIATWNQVAASASNLGWKLPYFRRNKKT